jgi:hypothetical protein
MVGYRRMFDLWRVKWKKGKAERKFRSQWERLKSDKNSTPQDLAVHSSDEYYELKGFDEWIEAILSDRLTEKARELDVEMPGTNDRTCWQQFEDSEVFYLTAHGRSLVRKLVDDEKNRRFEVVAKWIRLIAPIITAAAGFVGALIGLIAIHKK